MTGWPFRIIEVALYALFGSILIAMARDAVDRWREHHTRKPADGEQDRQQSPADAADSAHEDESPISAVRHRGDV